MCFCRKTDPDELEIFFDKFIAHCRNRAVRSICEDKTFDATKFHPKYHGWLNLFVQFDWDIEEFLCPGIVQYHALQYFCFPDTNKDTGRYYPDLVKRVDALKKTKYQTFVCSKF